MAWPTLGGTTVGAILVTFGPVKTITQTTDITLVSVDWMAHARRKAFRVIATVI